MKGVSFVTFFIGCNFDKLFFTVKKGEGEGFYSLCEGGTWKGAGWFFSYLFYCWGGRGWKLMFFFSPDVWKGGRRRGERGTFRFLEMFFSREGFTRGYFFTNSLWDEGKGAPRGKGAGWFKVEGLGFRGCSHQNWVFFLGFWCDLPPHFQVF